MPEANENNVLLYSVQIGTESRYGPADVNIELHKWLGDLAVEATREKKPTPYHDAALLLAALRTSQQLIKDTDDLEANVLPQEIVVRRPGSDSPPTRPLPRVTL